MPKSLEISSRGLDFDRLMKAVVKVKVEEPKSKGSRHYSFSGSSGISDSCIGTCGVVI